MLCIKNGRIHDMVNPEAYEGDILVDEGKIVKMGQGLEIPEGTEIYDAAGKDVYPGFIDAHSHLGLDGYGIGFEGQDYNEMNDICASHLRGIDSLIPRCIRQLWEELPVWERDQGAPMFWEEPSLQ